MPTVVLQGRASLFEIADIDPAWSVDHDGMKHLVLSHKTAWLYRYTVKHDRYPPCLPAPANAAPRQWASALDSHFISLGLSEEAIDSYEIAVRHAENRKTKAPFTFHQLPSNVMDGHVTALQNGFGIVDDTLLFLQAAAWMTFLELVEYGYELCGTYRTDHLDVGIDTERQHAQTAASLMHALDNDLRGMAGIRQARNALRFVHDGSRSVMESGLAMLICLPQTEGGLGIEDIEMNHRIEVEGSDRRFTKSPYFEIDVYKIGSKRGAEYDGRDHTSGERRSHDAERRNALAEMGYSFKTLTAGQFANQLSLHRALCSVAKSFGIDPPTSSEFQARQNELRKFVIRQW